jgi:hypothetical protein
MWYPFRRIHCRCTSCAKVWYIPRRRILRLERFFEVRKGQRFVWTCLECNQGVVFPAEFTNSFGETVSLDPEHPPDDIIVLQL